MRARAAENWSPPAGAASHGRDAPDDISPEFWAILERAFDSDASWVLFDRDEPVSPDFPVFADSDCLEEHQP